MKRLRQDLVHLRDLAVLIRDREATKMEQTINAVEVLSMTLFPHEHSLREALSKISESVTSTYSQSYINVLQYGQQGPFQIFTV